MQVNKNSNADAISARVSDRLPLAVVTTLTPTRGDIAYNLTADAPYYADGTQWLPFGGGGSEDILRLNYGITASLQVPGETILRVPFNVDRGTVQNFTFAAGVGTCTVAGWYDITATINARQGEIELGTPGYAQVLIVKNENPFDITEGVMASQSTAYFAQVVLDGIFTVSSKALVQFDVGDTVTIKIYNFANAVAQEFTILTSTVLSGLKVS